MWRTEDVDDDELKMYSFHSEWWCSDGVVL